MSYQYHDSKGEHLHTLDGKPLMGISTVAKAASGSGKDALTWWASRCAVERFGWMKAKDENGNWVASQTRVAAVEPHLVRVQAMTPDEFLSELDGAYKAHNETKNRKAKEGTTRHASLEDYAIACLEQNGGKPLRKENWLPGYFAPEVESFIDFAMTEIREFAWSEANCFSRELWTGGIADLGYYDHQGRLVCADHKSAKAAYFEHFVQIAGYDLNLSENGGWSSDGRKLFEATPKADYYAVFPFGSRPFTPQYEFDVEGYREAFRAALTLHRLHERFKESQSR